MIPKVEEEYTPLYLWYILILSFKTKIWRKNIEKIRNRILKLQKLKEKPYVNGLGENNPRVKYMKDYKRQWSENQTFQSLTNKETNSGNNVKWNWHFKARQPLIILIPKVAFPLFFDFYVFINNPRYSLFPLISLIKLLLFNNRFFLRSLSYQFWNVARKLQKKKKINNYMYPVNEIIILLLFT